jgi:hypothetical protein
MLCTFVIRLRSFLAMLYGALFFSTTVPTILELYFSLTYESRALLSDFSTYILSAEQDYEIKMNAY